MRRGFSLLEVLLATIILGSGLTAILLSVSQAHQMMMAVPELETAQEVMDLGEMAFPLALVKDKEKIEIRSKRVSELWEELTDERMTDAQEEKFHGFYWQRELIDDHLSDDDLTQFNRLLRVKVTVSWGERGQGRGKKQEESYIALWREPK